MDICIFENSWVKLYTFRFDTSTATNLPCLHADLQQLHLSWKGKQYTVSEDCTDQLFSFAKSPLVTIFVAPEKEEFTIHKYILVAKYDFLKDDLSKEIPEGSKANYFEWTSEYETPRTVDAVIT